MQNTWPKICASTLDLSRVHVLHHVQSHVIPTYTLRSIHVTDSFRVNWISASNSRRYRNVSLLHGHECGDRGHAIRCDLNEKMVVRLNVIDPLISFRWLVTIREENRRQFQPMNAPRGIERNVSPFVPFLDVAHMLDRRCTSATRWIRVYGNCHVAWKFTLADFFFSGWNMLFVDNRCRSRIHE